MPGQDHPCGPARGGAHWHWSYHRALQNLRIKEGKQENNRQECEADGMRLPRRQLSVSDGWRRI